MNQVEHDRRIDLGGGFTGDAGVTAVGAHCPLQ
jgi:hypothetical protein